MYRGVSVFLVLACTASCAPLRATAPKTAAARPVQPAAHYCNPDSPAECYDMPLVVNARVRRWVRHYQTDGRRSLARALTHSTRDLAVIKSELAIGGAPEDLAYFVMLSDGKSATGPWRLSDEIAKANGVRTDWWQNGRRDADASTRAAARHLAWLYKRYKNWHLVTAAYTAGHKSVDSAIRKSGQRNYWKLAGYLPREHRDDVPKLMAVALIAKHPDRYGFSKLEYKPEMRFDSIGVADATSLVEVAGYAGVGVSEVRRLNPALRRGCTPPGVAWDIRVPQGKGNKVRLGLLRSPEPSTCRRHQVRRGETLAKIARKYGTSTHELLIMNEGTNPRDLKVGQYVAVRIIIEAEPRKPIDRTRLPEPFLDDDERSTSGPASFSP